MKITHHPDDATLMSYAAGSLPESLAAVVSTHLAMCPHCQHEVRVMERVGTALMEILAPASLTRAVPQMALRAMEAEVGTPAVVEADPLADIPTPLRHLAGSRINEIHWKRLGMGIWNVPLKLSHAGDGDLRLLRVGPGRAMPEHGHGGSELTLILRGCYRDEFGEYWPGDVADLDELVEHRPLAHPELGCICLIASERPAKFKGLFGRMLQPLTGL